MYVVTVNTAAITHVVPQVFYQGAYPVKPLSDGMCRPRAVLRPR